MFDIKKFILFRKQFLFIKLMFTKQKIFTLILLMETITGNYILVNSIKYCYITIKNINIFTKATFFTIRVDNI